jgi:hypothetical protein
LLHCFGILDANHSTLGTALMVGKDNLDPELIAGFVQQTGQHPHRIEQLNGIKRLMDIAFNHRTIDAGLAAFLDVFVFGMHQQIPKNAFPCMREKFF